jgi:hypothetical protein
MNAAVLRSVTVGKLMASPFIGDCKTWFLSSKRRTDRVI